MGKNNIRLYKKFARMNVYKAGDGAVIDQKLLDSVDWPQKNPYCSFIIKRVPLNPARPLRFAVSNKYAQMLYCFYPKSGIKLHPPPATTGITARPPKSLAELVRVSYLEKVKLLKLEGKKAGYSVRHDWQVYKTKFLPKAKALLFFKGEKFQTLCVCFRRRNIYGEMESYISWHPKLGGLTPAEARSVRYQEALWLKKHEKGRVSGFSMAKGDANYKFLAALGFETDRVVFERKDA